MRARCVITLLAACAVLGLAPRQASAQDTLSVAARLVARQPVGAVLRVHAANMQFTGVFQRVENGTLFLSDPPQRLPLRTIDDAWLQRRSTGRGAKVGAIVGASTGAVLFGFGALVLSGVCEYECDIDGAGDIAVATLLGGALGTGAGLGIGALIGSGIPRWERLTESSTPATVIDPRTRTNLSAFSIAPAAARGVHSDEVGTSLSVSYLSQLTRHFGLGLEIAGYDTNAPDIVIEFPCGEEQCSYTERSDMGWSAGGIARVGAGAHRSVEPYAIFGVGLYQFPYGLNLGGFSAGGGLRVRPGGGRIALSGEGRYHSNWTNSASDVSQGFYTAGLVLSYLR